ncbi:polysaccharide export outer membrane protein [Pontibacter ummariensis]|uniref:Polysaccharide export outer membrane protein n=1 Tax=Pontibacter ummariensis TaxID=1610492 RepID=A0A239EL31_9BACT|nr:polysaccharide biosynthesis/export family protein [Pontibacter ummariensis]PRY13318.1 polysaccharide export outer membrane protein [Pontibacter ummariensis]SNS45337.1 polysaccharide export outer membrane protein [Pontibacter ummariensis]
MKLHLLYLFAFLFLVSCTPRNLAYFSDIPEQATYEEKILNDTEPKIQAYDLLSITVTSLNPEASALFNTGIASTAGSITNFSMTSTAASNVAKEGYLVDKEGNIAYPILGKVQVAGLTKAQVTEKFTTQLREHLKEPIVNVRYLNYKVTVVGEVNRPSTFTIPSERINIIEALGMAGDMTAFGKRENVLVMREENGVRKMMRLNLNSKEVVNSPYFYLQQNDVVYVEPDRMKEVQASANTRTLSIIAAAASIVSVFVARLF